MPVELLSGFLRYRRAIVLGALGGVIAASWAYLWLGVGVEMEMMGLGGGHLMTMLPEWNLPYALLIFVMWVVMMAAMMLPGAAPTVLLVAVLAKGRLASSTRPLATAMLFAAGYLLVWCGFTLAAAFLQWGLDEAGLLSVTMAFGNETLAGAVLAFVGLYQWTPLKGTCLRHCRSTEFVVRHWRQGALGAILTGIRHGIFCFGCCGREWSNSQPLPLEGIGDRKANSEGRCGVQRYADSGVATGAKPSQSSGKSHSD